MGNDNTDVNKPAFSRLRGDTISDVVQTTASAGGECLNVYDYSATSTGGGTEYQDASNQFTTGASSGTAVMAIVGSSAVAVGNIGALSMTADRKLRVDSSATSTTSLNSERRDGSGYSELLTSGLAVGGIVSPTTAVTAGSYGTFAMTPNREQVVLAVESGTWNVTSTSNTYDSWGVGIDSETHGVVNGLVVHDNGQPNACTQNFITVGSPAPTQFPTVSDIHWIFFRARSGNAAMSYLGTAGVATYEICPLETTPRLDLGGTVNLNTFWVQGGAGDIVDYWYSRRF